MSTTQPSSIGRYEIIRRLGEGGMGAVYLARDPLIERHVAIKFLRDGLENEGLRRLLVNACYWGLGLEGRIPPRNDVGLVGAYSPLNFGFGKHRKGLRPSDLK